LTHGVGYMFPWAHPSPQRKRHFDRFSHFCIVHGRVSLGMPGDVLSSKNLPFVWGDLDPHLTHDSLCQPESTHQMASQPIQLFLHSSRYSVPILYNGPPFPLKIAPSNAGSGPPLIDSSLGPSEPITQTISRSVQPFLHSSLQSVHVLYNGPCPFPWGVWTLI